MRRKCHGPKRNYCAPDGKIAALLVDVDGTISVCERYFNEAKDRFAFFMKTIGFKPADATRMIAEAELAHVKTHGFERDGLGKAMVEAYTRLCKSKGVRSNRHFMGICEDIGRSPFFREPELFPNAAAVLGRAHHNFMMFAVSIGNREAQKFKVRQAGLDAVFDDLIISSQDNKAELVAELIEDLNIDPRFSAHIGNSRRSDGACLQHTNFIYLPMEPGWAFDKAELPKDTGFQVFECANWREAEEQAINRLVRRRRAALDAAGADSSTSESADESEDKE